ncbi:MAG: hypothetical protein KBT46_02595 [Ruminococcus sp.]|nr:hypothetical protein [Candidatus Copronaster equi]
MLIYLIAATLIVSFAWGMRGDLIGGEEGATLPGAFIGLSLALLFGNMFMFENLYIFVALGMTGIFIGGAETYAETLSFSFWGDGFNPKPESLSKGLIGVAVKGMAWFGICAATIGIGFTSVTIGSYKPYEFVILILVMLAVRFIGAKIINKPAENENHVLNKIYFSKTRSEEWAGMLLMLITMFVFALIHKDYFACKLICFGSVGGAVGWIIAQFFHSASKSKFKNGKYLFGKMNENKFVDAWKNMEFTLGALGSLSIALGFVLQKDTVNEYILSASYNKSEGSAVVGIIYAVLICLYALSNLFKYRSEKILKVCEVINRPVLCYIPMVLIFMGYYQVAKILALVVLPFFALEELCFVQLKEHCKKKAPVLSVIVFAVFAGLMALSFTEFPNNLSAQIKPYSAYILYFIVVSVIYVICALWASIAKYEFNTGKKFCFNDCRTLVSINSYYIFCIIVGTILFVSGNKLFL